MDGFCNAKKDAENQKRPKSLGYAKCKRTTGPEGGAEGPGTDVAKSINDESGDKRHAQITKSKGAKKNPKLGIAERECLFDRLNGKGNGASIEIIDNRNECNEEDDSELKSVFYGSSLH